MAFGVSLTKIEIENRVLYLSDIQVMEEKREGDTVTLRVVAKVDKEIDSLNPAQAALDFAEALKSLPAHKD